MYQQLHQQFINNSIVAHRQGKELHFLSMSETDFKRLESSVPSPTPKNPMLFGLRILRTKDLNPNEFIFH